MSETKGKIIAYLDVLDKLGATIELPEREELEEPFAESFAQLEISTLLRDSIYRILDKLEETRNLVAGQISDLAQLAKETK
ncbi:hypothetical protein LCGC14_0195280 [marine sediment metagenome]|uniref:Uncharacterized protein n=1 Tax=marine sediment metagenome TaxID=412755 RepID=A0A0F9UKA9_9ZZZZ